MLADALKIIVGRNLAKGFPRLWMERELRFRPHHFERELWLVPAICDKEKIAIDVGANQGVYSYYMSKFSRDVIAFEPNTDLWKDLHRLLGREFHIEAAALSGKFSQATMRIDTSNTGISTIEEKNDLSCAEDREAIVARVVETKPLDSFHFTDVSMIKIDVEGHEEAVIEGAGDTIRRNRPVLIIESEDRHNPGAPQRLVETFSKLEYSVFYIKDRQLLEYNTLREEDADLMSLVTGGSTYINNFIFVPAEQINKIERAQALLSVR